MTYGLITERDAHTMNWLLSMVVNTYRGKSAIKTLELGVHNGDTSRGIRDFFLEAKAPHKHIGIDNQRDFAMGSPFPECEFIIGDTMLVSHEVENNSVDFLFIDACHNLPMTIADFVLYKEKVKNRGIVAFHDTGSHIAPFTDYQGQGQKDQPDMYISCRKAIRMLGLPLLPYMKKNTLGDEWLCIIDEADPSRHTGGITAYIKNPDIIG